MDSARGMTTLDDPFTPPAHLDQRRDRTPVRSPRDEAIRRAHLSHEAWIRSIGRFNRLGLIAVPFLIYSVITMFGRGPLPALKFLELFVLALCAASGWVGHRMTRLDPGSRLPAAVLHGVGLVGFPVGTALSAGILYLLLSKKGRRVMSPEYQGVVARTPHIRCPTPWAIWVIFIVLCVVLFVAMAFAWKST